MATARTRRLTGTAARGLAAAAALLAPAAHGAPLSVTVLDRESRPVANVAVIVTPDEPAASVPARPREPAVMNQIEREFVPHVLVIQTGSRVAFPNDDNVNHHVYSFSSPKSFELELYKGSPHPPLDFDRPGLVVLGCNIHDDMLGYILVVDTPYFANTNAEGVARFEGLPAGPLSVRAWTPRLRPDELPPEQRIGSTANASADVVFELTERLLPEREGRSTSLSWSDY